MVEAVIVGSVEGRGPAAKAKIPSDRVINSPRKVAVLCFGGKLFSSDSETGTERGQQ